MIRGIIYSKTRAALCAGAFCALIAAGALCHHTASSRSSWLRQAADREGILCAQIAGLGECEDSELEAMRGRVRELRARLGSPDAWERLVGHLGAGWVAGPVSREEMGGYLAGVGSISLREPSISDWPRIVEAVRAIEEVPGAGILDFEMRTSGDRERRVVDTVTVVVSTQTARTPKQQLAP